MARSLAASLAQKKVVYLDHRSVLRLEDLTDDEMAALTEQEMERKLVREMVGAMGAVREPQLVLSTVHLMVVRMDCIVVEKLVQRLAVSLVQRMAYSMVVALATQLAV
jgi:hypothetical protein